MRDEEDFSAFEEELVDRFGALPPAPEKLIGETRIDMLARAAGIPESMRGQPQSH